MKHGIQTAFALSLCLAALSCSEEMETSMSGGISKALVQTADFTPTDDFRDLQTRSDINPTTSPIAFSWSEGDKLGVYSVDGTGMTNFEIDLRTVSDNPKVATFKASGFNLKGGDEYIAFSPYNGNNTNKAQVAVSYEGIRQEGNGTFSHLGAYDYQWAKAKAEGSTEAANIKFDFAHAGAICRFRISDLPRGIKFNRMTITCDGIFTKGTIDLTQPTPTIVAAQGNSTTQSVSLGTEGGSITIAEDGQLTVYTMMAAADLSDKTMTVCLFEEGYNMSHHFFTVCGKKMVAGSAYGYSMTFVPAEASSDYIDIGIVRGDGTPVLFGKKNLGATDDNKMGLLLPWTEQDPVTKKLGYNWRTATDEELGALFNVNGDSKQPALSWVWHENGVTVTNIQDGHSCKGNSLFLPMKECEEDYDTYYAGYYWCSKADADKEHAKFYKLQYENNAIAKHSGNMEKSTENSYLPIYIGPKVNNN